MNLKKISNYEFENDVMVFESLIDELSNDFFKEFDKLADQVQLSRKIDDLISGRVVNFSENQSAIHPKYRKYGFDAKTPHHLIDSETNSVTFYNQCLNASRKKGYTSVNFITIGIGGSFEGPKLLLESLNSPIKENAKGLENIHFDFITGSDCSEFEYKTKFLDPNNTFFIVSSKSFTTQETLESLKKALDWCNNKNHFIAITANPDKVAKYEIDNVISFDKEIGGRYSIWSPITQFHLHGQQRRKFQKGGYQADLDLCQNKDYLAFIKRLSYSDIFLSNKGKNVRAILSYLWNLRSLPNYFQQLEMESLGKPNNPEFDFNNTGQIIFGGYGPTAQHSYFQLLHQGTHKICADIISSSEDRSSLAYVQSITQSKLLAYGEGEIKLENDSKINGNVSTNLFLLKKLDAFNLGYLIASWEHRTFITASMLGINPFDQFGVNAGKIYTKKYLADKN